MLCFNQIVNSTHVCSSPGESRSISTGRQSPGTTTVSTDRLHDIVQVYLRTPQFTSFTLISWMTNSEDPCRRVTVSSNMGNICVEDYADNAANRTDCIVQGNTFPRTGSLTAQNCENGVLSSGYCRS